MCQNPNNNNNMKRPSSSSSSRPSRSRRASHHQDISLVQRAAYELEKLRRSTNTNCNKSSTSSSSCDGQPGFPFACRQLLRKIPGNDRCVDCGCRNNPDWASITYGVLMCVNCSGKHRSYGVNISRVRSINMDSWNHKQVMAMLEGGNMQLNGFCERHQLMLPSSPSSSSSTSSSDDSSSIITRYHTKAAKFYRTHLSMHVEKLLSNKGYYKGRQIARTSTSCSSKSNNTDRDSKNASEDVNATTTTTSSPSSSCNNNPTTTTTTTKTTTTTPIHHHHHHPNVVVSDVVPITTNRFMVTARVA